MSITYHENDTITPEELAEIFLQSGIKRPTHDLERLGRMLAQADELLTARADGKLVGVLRAITDYAYCCYISDLAVDRDYHGQRIGESLMKKLQEKLGNEEVQYILISAPTAVGFYERIGMERLDKAFVIRRQR
ncbi:GNAT family N-acetyltransferase [Paenibacillus sp. 1011MAR3C5]|uniref:GNAT family N-acetyltransferase n=1 Tax=Paenibacillus sp. 1011MAR3C5 TaxID=1675787 RepID=UPI000E6B936F|nr:GNAT family N-acetyltransferase [Paenibacillus sp. 1011MAR3C5]RJE90301.1 GNAT family N-acetyltransferase [Paenibacillus sp. 1011MAR3C5]